MIDSPNPGERQKTLCSNETIFINIVSHFSLKLYAMQGKRNAGSNKAKY